MIKRPESLKIFGRTYRIVYHPKAAYGDQPCGNCENSQLTINITEGQHPIEERDTVLHEVLHALFYVMTISLSEEETVVRPMAAGLTGVFQDNPEFAKWLAESPNKKPSK